MRCVQIIHNNTGLVRLVPFGSVSTKTKDERMGYIVECHEEEAETPIMTREQFVKKVQHLNVVRQSDKIKRDLKELQQEIGPGGLGDLVKKLVKPVAKMTGKENCSGCEVRRLIGNAFGHFKRKYGFITAVTMVKDLTAMSLKEKPQDVLAKLQEEVAKCGEVERSPETLAKIEEVKAAKKNKNK